MARPRVFVSSTYFDLRTVRADLERFIKELGYEPVLFEHGHIPYGKEEALEEYCYREISLCDILIAIVGGKYGSQSRDGKHSITERELKTGIELGKQIYVFVEKSVLGEHKTYQGNKHLEGFKPVSVSDTRVFDFLDELYSLPAGNPIEPFEIAENITRYLKEQWAGLFQRLLQENARQKEIDIIGGLKSTADTLNRLVTFLTEERAKGDQAIKDILLSSHPAFAAIKRITRIPYRVVFYTLEELEALLLVRSFEREDDPFQAGVYEWHNRSLGVGIKIDSALFDEQGRLRIVTPEEWDDKFIKQFAVEKQKEEEYDIPF